MDRVDQVEVGRLRIAFRRRGHGPPLVLLHGGMSDGREWRRQVDDLSDEFTVVAWDAPGCGRSDDPPEGFRLADYADRVAGLVDALGLGRPHLLGLSFGAGLALEVYRRRPGLPRTLVLASAYAGWAGSLPAELVRERLEQVLREADEPPEAWVRDWLPSLLGDAPDETLAGELAQIIRESRPAGMRAMARAFAEADLRDVLPRIRVPTLLLHGERDRRSPLGVAHEMHASIPGSLLVVMSGVGHQCNMEAPARFSAEVRAFLRAAAG